MEVVRASLVVLLVFTATVSTSRLQQREIDRPISLNPTQRLHTLQSLQEQVGTTITKVSYDNGEWSGYISCDLIGQSGECDLSVHEQGFRIDINKHKPNMEVIQSCNLGQNSIGLTIHGFSYNDVLDYTCLSSGSSSWSTDSGWLWAFPRLDAYVPETAQVGDQATFTCSSYTGTPLYWAMPGFAANRTGVVISTDDNGINSTSIISFLLTEADNYGQFWCCAKLNPNQETATPCVLYDIAFNKLIHVTHVERYPAGSPNWEIICQFQGYPDPQNIKWEQCDSSNVCNVIASTDQLNPLSHFVASNVTIPASEAFHYTCSASNPFGTVTATLYPISDNFAPSASLDQKLWYYSTTDGFAFRMSCTITAHPIPEMHWSVQNFWSQSNGSTYIYPGQTGKYQVINSLIGLNTYDTTLIIQPFDFDLDHATYACIAVNDYGFGGVETEAEIGPENVAIDVCGGPNHVVDDNVDVVFSYYGFPPPYYDISVVADNDVNYRINEHYQNTTGINLVRVTFKATQNNPHIQVIASAFFPYVLFTNQLTADVFVSQTTPAPQTTTAPQPYCN